MKVVVTGATGNVGSAVLAALAACDQVDEIVGVARRVPTLPLPKVRWHAADVSRDPLDVIAGADAVIHLAWKIQPQHRPEELFETNVVGTRRVADAVVRHGVPAMIHASSVGAYAPGPKDPPVDERWPAMGIRSSVYSRHKAMAEAVLDRVEREAPTLRVVRMRTSLVFQRRAASEVHRLFLGPLAPHRLPRRLRVVPSGEWLSFQATHADDIGRAYLLAATCEVRGAFNIAAAPVLTPEVIAEVTGARRVPVPWRLLRGAVDLTWRARLQPTEAGWLDMAVQTPIMSTQRARDELGWAPLHSSTDALDELLQGMAERAGGPTRPLHPDRHGDVDDSEPLEPWLVAPHSLRSLRA